MAVAFIQGASRGIGLEFARCLSARGGVQVVAGCRDPDAATSLHGLARVEAVRCDVTREASLAGAAADILANHGKLDFAINVAGILHPSGRGEVRLSDVTIEALQVGKLNYNLSLFYTAIILFVYFQETFQVNTFGPLVMAKHFSPLLQRGGGLIGTQSSKPRSQHAGLLAHISAR